MSGVFEVRGYDARGRRGELSVPRRGVTVETPALLPVVNPHVQTVPPSRLAEFGAEILITNSYVLHGSDDLRGPARERGLHDLLDFDGAIMTDSGSFQLAEYGDIDVTTEEILRFQHEIGSDIGTPVDIPTPPDADRERAREEWATTRERLARAETVDTGEMLVSAPVQGSTHPALREEAAREASATDLDLFPVGAVVPLLNDYRFDTVVDVVVAAKRGLGEAAPVHLFGAGHPMMFALAAALGCDLFDSAAYALYARDGRYLTVRGTEHLEELSALPCACHVCADHTPGDIRGADDDERHRLLAEHNLAVSFAETRRVRQALRRGNLLELLEARARAHPAMLDGYRQLLEYAGWLEGTDSVSKDTLFYLSPESARRPEVVRHHERLARLEPTGDVVLTEGGASADDGETWGLVPPFGPVPPALADVYPLTAELPDHRDREALNAAAEGVRRLVEANPETGFALGHRDWPETVLARVPDRVRVENRKPR